MYELLWNRRQAMAGYQHAINMLRYVQCKWRVIRNQGICDEIEAFKQHFKTLQLWMSLLLQFAFEELL